MWETRQPCLIFKQQCSPPGSPSLWPPQLGLRIPGGPALASPHVPFPTGIRPCRRRPEQGGLTLGSHEFAGESSF